MAELIIGDQTLDLFDDEHVQIIQSLKKIFELEGVFSEYSREFTVPASKKNNDIFNHYHKIDQIQPQWPAGINPHKEIPAILVLEDAREIVGSVEMRGVTYHGNQPEAYIITFYGDLGGIKAQLEKWNLNNVSDVDFTAFDFTYTLANIEATWNTPGDVLIPIQATELFYIYDETERPVNNQYNPANIAPFPRSAPVNQGGGVKWRHLKPAYYLKSIVETILNQVTYDGTNTFTTTWDAGIDDFLDNAYIGPSVEPGGLEGYQVGGNTNFYATAFGASWFYTSLLGGYERWRFFATEYDYAGVFNIAADQFNCAVDGIYTFQSDIEFRHSGGPLPITVVMRQRMSIDRAGTLIYVDQPQSTISVNGSVGPTRREFRSWLNIELRAGDVVSLEIEFITNTQIEIIGNWWKQLAGGALTENVTYQANNFFPDMSAYDFISNFLTTFNLLMVTDESTILLVDVEKYYQDGLANLKDWTTFVDVTNVSSRKLEVPKETILRFNESEDFRNVQFARSNSGRPFGEFTFASDTDFGSEKQEQQSIFTVMNPNRMTYERDPNSLVDLPMTFQFNEEGNAINIEFWLFFYSGLKTCADYWFQTGVDVNGNDTVAIRDTMPMTQSWYNTLGHLAGRQTDKIFSYSNESFWPYGNEDPAAYPLVINTVFETFFSNWLQRKYDANTRKIVWKGTLPIGEYINFKLNDRIIIDGKWYIVTELKYDMLDESVELTTVTFDDEFRLTTLDSYDVFGFANVTVSRGDVVEPSYDNAPQSWLKSYSIKKIFPELVTARAGNFTPRDQSLGVDIVQGIFREPVITGVIEGGVVTANVANPLTQVDISAGIGVMVDPISDPVSPTFITVEWESVIGLVVDVTANIGSNVIAIDVTGTAVQFINQYTPEIRRANIVLALVSYYPVPPSVTPEIVYLVEGPRMISQQGEMLHDFVSYLSSEVKRQGVLIARVTADLNVWITAGSQFIPNINYPTQPTDPNVFLIPGDGNDTTPTIFNAILRDGTVVGPYATIPKFWDNGTATPQALLGTRAVIHYVYYSLNGQTWLQLGQTEYPSHDDAVHDRDIDAVGYTYAPQVPLLLKLGQIIIDNAATDFSDPARATIWNFGSGGTSGGGGVSGIFVDTPGLQRVTTSGVLSTDNIIGEARLLFDDQGILSVHSDAPNGTAVIYTIADGFPTVTGTIYSAIGANNSSVGLPLSNHIQSGLLIRAAQPHVSPNFGTVMQFQNTELNTATPLAAMQITSSNGLYINPNLWNDVKLNSDLYVNGSFGRVTRTVTASTTVDSVANVRDSILIADVTTAAAINFTLPTPTIEDEGRELVFKLMRTAGGTGNMGIVSTLANEIYDTGPTSSIPVTVNGDTVVLYGMNAGGTWYWATLRNI